MGFVQRRILKLVLGVVERPKLTLALAGLALAGSIVLALVRLNISTDTNKLFNRDVAFFRDYLEFTRKFPENEAVYVLVETRDPSARPPVARWTAIADAITQRLGQIPQHLKAVDSRVPIDKLGAAGLLFERRELLEQAFGDIKQFAQLAKLWGESSPLTTFMGRTPIQRFLSALTIQKPDAQTVEFENVLAESWVKTLGSEGDLN